MVQLEKNQPVTKKKAVQSPLFSHLPSTLSFKVPYSPARLEQPLSGPIRKSKGSRIKRSEIKSRGLALHGLMTVPDQRLQSYILLVAAS